MADSEETLLKNDVAIIERNDLIPQRQVMKRARNVNGFEEKPTDEKRQKETFSDDVDEIQLRDKLLDEISSNKLCLDSDSMIHDVTEFEHGGSNESQQAQNRKIIKLEGVLPNLALPDGWIALNHRSGGIVYLHRSTRVCTWGRPYYIGKGSVRKHDVPVAAIPCLHQAKALANKSQKTNKPSNEIPLDVDHQPGQGQGLSILNFLNTAGSIEGETHLAAAHYEAFQSHKPTIEKAADGNVKSGLSMEVVNDYNKEEICNTFESNSLQENGNYHTFKKMNIVNEDSSEKNQVYCTVKNENEDVDDCQVKNVDGGHGVSYRTSNICPCEDRYDNIFHPKDGLDVVNETLNYGGKELKKDDEMNSASSNVPIPSIELMSPEHLQSINLKSTQSDQVNHENLKIPSLQSVSLKGSRKEIHENKEIFYNGTSAEDEHSLDAQTTSDDNFKKNPNLPKTTHQTSGIELIDAEELSSYLGKLFDFKKITIDQEKNVVKPSEAVMEEADPVLSVLECLPYCVKGKNAKENKEWVLNPGGKTPVAILHEYSQAVLKEKPVYVSTECENSSTPFMAEVQINGITHGSGMASTKKQAKQIAAEVALEVLLPHAFHKIRDYVISREELECFDKLKIDNPNIHELSIKSGLPSPSQVLQECLKRNQGVCSSTIHFKMIPGQNQEHTFIISCGKHQAEGPCKNKRIGKQVASQALLMKLHPHISTWGSLLRIYCDRPSSIVKKYKTPDYDSLSNCISTPDVPRGKLLLARLKEEMLKIADDVNQESKYSRSSDDTGSISTVDI